MDIRERIKNVMVDALIETRLEELSKETLASYRDKAKTQVDTGNTPDNKELKRIKGIGKAEKRLIKGKQGPNTRASVTGKKSKAPQPPSEGGNVHSMGVNKGGGEDKAFDKKMEKIDQSNAKFLSKVK